MTTVFVTHDQTEANALADRIAVMEEGVLQQFAHAGRAQGAARPTCSSARFIGEPPMNVFDAAHRAGRRRRVHQRPRPGRAAGFPPCRLRLPRAARSWQAQRVRLGIRPHAIALGDGPGAVRGIVVSNQWLGDQTHLGVEVGRLPRWSRSRTSAVDAPIGERDRCAAAARSACTCSTRETGARCSHGVGAAALHDARR